MSESPSSLAPHDESAHCDSTRERVVLSLVLVALIRTGEALAADQAVVIGGNANTPSTQLRQSEVAPQRPTELPSSSPVTLGDFTAPKLSDIKVFSATEFRPRRHTPVDTDPLNTVDNVPLLWNSTVWQRMSDYRSRNRVRLLTLWESTGGSVSLQAGTHGDPSLQWTSHWMNRGGSTRGVLDHLFSVSVSGAGEKLRSLSRSVNSQETPAKQLTTGPVAAAVK